jgi:hypothetical protein
VFDGAGVDGGDAIVGTSGALAVARAALVNAVASVELVKSVTLRDPFGGTGAVPGGVNKNLSIAERDAFLKDIEQIMTWSRGAVQLAREFTLAHLKDLEVRRAQGA